MINYPIQSFNSLKTFLDSYINSVLLVSKKFNIDLEDEKFSCDHLGLQVMSSDEFEECHFLLLKLANVTRDEVIHQRRVRMYRFKQPVESHSLKIPGIEIFEPKPDADLSKLRPGIEHIAFKVDGYEGFVEECIKNNVPIDKEVKINDSKFFKTKLIDNIEIEFRNDELVK